METMRSEIPKKLRIHEIIGPNTINISPYFRSNIDLHDPRLQKQLLNKRYFYLRNDKIKAILKFLHILVCILHKWFHKHQFMEFHAPILKPCLSIMRVKIRMFDVGDVLLYTR